MAFTLGTLLQVCVLIVNAIAVLHEERFLKKGACAFLGSVPDEECMCSLIALPAGLVWVSGLRGGSWLGLSQRPRPEQRQGPHHQCAARRAPAHAQYASSFMFLCLHAVVLTRCVQYLSSSLTR